MQTAFEHACHKEGNGRLHVHSMKLPLPELLLLASRFASTGTIIPSPERTPLLASSSSRYHDQNHTHYLVGVVIGVAVFRGGGHSDLA